MRREFVCIICPNGCELAAEVEGKTIHSISGQLCLWGESYVRQEILDPRRNIASSVKVVGGELPLVSVRLSDVIPKDMIFAVMDAIRQAEVAAPVAIGQVLIKGVAGLPVDVIATKRVLATSK
jgi:CxxC motif-containing protein